ncbi:hypothetical protein CEP51_009248 [Fusarium floridanum]|uniref:Methyltransferase domain-containing protein n=1 Tax=Fusarium floridanum TaxID=1325733 RepID=A0A428RI92_9HYPO|nr:hypothetical protein CEP51_009248 [Fusarium floridanum]
MTVATPAHNAGSIRFTPIVLVIYDLYVIRVSAPLIWRCSVQKHLRPLFSKNFSQRHVDIGVGNGYFPIRALKDLGRKAKDQHLTLVDLSQASLSAAKQGILSRHPEIDIRTIHADAGAPLPASLANEKFGSASLSLIMHHMPGPTLSKSKAIRNAKSILAEDGVLVGSTILGKVWEKTEKGYQVKAGQKPGRVATFALGFYNKRGIFDNYEEDPRVFEQVLKEEFEEVETRIVGMIFIFRAAKPRRQ